MLVGIVSRAFSILSLFILFIFSMQGFASTPLIESLTSEPPDIKLIRDRGVLVVAMYASDTKPYYYLGNQGELTGIDVEFIRGFARLLNVDVEFDRTATTLNGVIQKIVNREADLAICKLSITFSRSARVLFSKPYLQLYQGLLVNRLALSKQQKGRSREETIQHLTGKIGVIESSSYVGYASRRFKTMEVMGYSTWSQAVEAVTKGEIVAAYRDDGEIKKVIRDDSNASLTLFPVVFKDASDPKGIAVPWTSLHLKSLINQYIDSLNLNLTADKILYDYEQVIEQIRWRTE